MSELKIGDLVQSKVCETLIGTVESFTKRGAAIVRVNGKAVGTVPEYWRKISGERR